MTTTTPELNVLLPQTVKTLSLSDRFTSLLNRLQPSPEALILISALLIGGSSGLVVVLFHYLIDLFQTLTFVRLLSYLSAWGNWTLVFVPVLGGLIVSLMYWQFQDHLGHGFSSLLSNPREQKISPLRPFIKMLAAAVSLGTGAALGPEGPSVEIGSNIGVLLGQTFQVSKERYRLLLGAGAAAGLAAGFNAPIAGVFFSLEIVLGTTFTTSAVSLILLSAVVSAVIAQTAFGTHPAFDLPNYQVLSHWEWIFYLGLGLLASLVSIAYTQTIKAVQACFRGEMQGFSWLGNLPQSVRLILGGFCVGAIALELPQILGVGYGTLQVILQGNEFPLYLLCLLLFMKLVATSISLGSGFVGGVFAPAMFLGACLGAIYGNILDYLLPIGALEIAPPAAYAMVGMAAVLASSVKAPLTAILLMFEMTQNYLIVLPLMVAVGVSFWVVSQIEANQAVQGLDLKQMGMDLEKQNELDVLQQVPVAAVMDHSYLVLPDSMSILKAGWIMIQEKCHTALVMDETDELIGVVTLTDVKKKIIHDSKKPADMSGANLTLNDISTAEILYAYEDETVADISKRMGARELYLLPVVERDNHRKVLGIIDRNHIGLAADLETTQESLKPYLSEALANYETA